MSDDPNVRPRQVWADNDKRSAGRTFRIDRLEDGKAVCTILTNSWASQKSLDSGSSWVRDMRGKTTRISLARFKRPATGYRLARDVD